MEIIKFKFVKSVVVMFIVGVGWCFVDCFFFVWGGNECGGFVRKVINIDLVYLIVF